MNNTSAVAPTLKWSKDGLTVAEKLKEAIANAKTIKLRPDMDYFQSCCRQRTIGDEMQAGSGFATDWLGKPFDEADLPDDWKLVEKTCFEKHLDGWVPYPDCPNLAPGCEAFKLTGLDVCGYVGVRELAAEEPDNTVYLSDPKHTGYVTVISPGCFQDGDETDFVVAIVGDEGGKPTLFTFHPGDPVQPSKLKMELKDDECGKWGKEVSVSDAIELGFVTCKIGLK